MGQVDTLLSYAKLLREVECVDVCVGGGAGGGGYWVREWGVCVCVCVCMCVCVGVCRCV